MTELLRRVHTWVGLFNLTILAIFAATGLSATFPRPASTGPDVREVAYDAPADLSDKGVADDVLARLNLPLVNPVPEWAVHRDDGGQLVLHFYAANGGYTVTVREAEHRVRVEYARSPMAEFVDTLHATTRLTARDIRVRLWAVYVNVSIFSLLFMAASGVWLWAATRPGLWWAQTSLLAGSGLFVVLWYIIR